MIAAKFLLSAALSATPLTLTIHAGSQTYVVHGSYNALTFSAAQVSIDYTSDRVFCADFDAQQCAQVLP